MVTLKSLSAFGILPAIDPAKVPEEFKQPISQAIERVLDAADAIGRLWHARRYRVFADLERIAGRFPRAIWHSPQVAAGPIQQVT